MSSCTLISGVACTPTVAAMSSPMLRAIARPCIRKLITRRNETGYILMYREHHVWQPHSVGSDRLAIFIDKRLPIDFICKRQNLEQTNEYTNWRDFSPQHAHHTSRCADARTQDLQYFGDQFLAKYSTEKKGKHDTYPAFGPQIDPLPSTALPAQ